MKKRKESAPEAEPQSNPIEYAQQDRYQELDSDPALAQRRETDEFRNKRSLLAGATPLLVGLLAGNMGDAAEVASKALIDEDQRQLKQDSSLMSYLRKRKIASDKASSPSLKKRFQQSAIEDEKGNIVLKTFDTFTGEIADTKHTKGFSPFLGKDPRTGELARVAKGRRGSEAVEVPQEGSSATPRFTVKEEKDLRSVQKSFLSDPLVKASRKAIASSNRAISLITSGNPIGHEGIKTIFPRMFGEVGNLAYQEQERFSGSPELQRRFFRLKSKYLEGTLSNDDASDLLEVARIMQEYDNQQLGVVSKSYIDTEKHITGMKGKDVGKAIRPMTNLPTPESAGKIPKKVRRSPVEGSVVKKFYQGSMRRMKRTNSGWELLD